MVGLSLSPPHSSAGLQELCRADAFPDTKHPGCTYKSFFDFEDAVQFLLEKGRIATVGQMQGDPQESNVAAKVPEGTGSITVPTSQTPSVRMSVNLKDDKSRMKVEGSSVVIRSESVGVRHYVNQV